MLLLDSFGCSFFEDIDYFKFHPSVKGTILVRGVWYHWLSKPIPFATILSLGTSKSSKYLTTA